MPNKKTADAVKILRRRYIGRNARKHDALRTERENLQIAQQIYDMRRQAGLTQAQLANKIGAAASVITRIETADYTGYTINTLRDIARVFGRRLEIHLVPEDAKSPLCPKHA